MIRDTALRRARVARGLTIEDVAATTRLSPRIVALLDDGRFDELPGGLYARSYVKAFALATGTDPNAAIARIERLLPAVPDPVGAIRDAIGCAAETPPLAADLDRIWSSIRARAQAGLARSNVTPLRVIVIRAASASLDTLLLCALNALLVGAIARFCDASASTIVEAARWSVAVLGAFTWSAYYVLLAGIGTHTAGTWVF
ncbi:MAG TPA: helix-turn-helix transcriptional regulator, partial [Vicinamibacterales bacterium]